MALHRRDGLDNPDDRDGIEQAASPQRVDHVAQAADSPSAIEAPEGPYEVEDFESPEDAGIGRLDLGSVLIPVPDTGQIQVELTGAGTPGAVFVATANGRYSVAAYAAPKSAGLWREVASELADSLRKESAAVAIEDGPWGREVAGVTPAGAVRFIGVDGYRWMIRCVATGPAETIDTLVAEAREALADTVVRRDDNPYPVRNPLPVTLPEPMLAQLQAAQAQALAQAHAAAQPQAAEEVPPEPEPDPAARRTVTGSAMQQLRSTITGG